jgi:hypothetical protein
MADAEDDEEFVDANAGDPVAPFALSPAEAFGNGPLNYTTKAARDIYNKATQPLFSENERFDCDPDKVRDLLTQTKQWGKDHNANDLLTVPTDANDPLNESKYLPDHYGEITLEAVRAHVTANIAGQPSLIAQQDDMFQSCLMASLSTVGRNKVTTRAKDYTTDDGRPSGLLLFKVIIQESTIDTNATTSAIRDELANLDTKIGELGYDIKKFNNHVRTQEEALAARGATTHDLTTHLFKAYQEVPDTKFQEYIAQKQNDSEEALEELKPDKLMKWAELKYSIRKRQGKWNAPSPDQEKILALEAEISKLKKAAPSKKTTSKNPKKSNGGNRRTKSNGGGQDDSWKKKPPDDPSNPGEITHNGRKFTWCKFHKMWSTTHDSSTCKKLGLTNDNQKPKSDSKRSNKNKQAKLATALGAIANDSESSSDEE